MSEFKKWLIIVGAALLCVVFLWFGYVLITQPAITSKNILLAIGCGAVLGGVFILGTPGKGRVWGVVVIGVGLYYFARAVSFFEQAWLTRLLGVTSWIAAVLIGYIAVDLVQNRSGKIRSESEDA